MSEPSREGPEHELDALLRECLPDDLPASVEARLEKRLGDLLSTRRLASPARPSALSGWLGLLARPAPSTLGRVLLGAAATLLCVSGLSLQAASARGADGLLQPMNVSLAVVRALQEQPSFRCESSDAALASRTALAARLYRRWIPLRISSVSEETMTIVYRSAEPPVVYELRLDRARLLPRSIRRGDIAPEEVATCTWDDLPPGVAP